MPSPQRILVTGASGFVGRHLTPALEAAWPNAALLTPMLELRDAADVSRVVCAAQPDVCVHLAAISSVTAARSDRQAAWQVNLQGSLLLGQAILQHAPTCHLLYASSSDVYGGSSKPIDESWILAPRNVYAATKAATDLALGAMVGEGLHLSRVRPFNHTGPGQSEQFVIPAFARQIARVAAGLQVPEMHVGDLSARRDFLDVRDVCSAYIACIERRDELPPGTIMNLGSGQSRCIGDVLRDMLDLAGITVEVRTDPARLRGAVADQFFANPSRAMKLLGWRPTIPWQQTLRDVLHDWAARVTDRDDA